LAPLTLAALGDSLTQGFRSGSIHDTGWSFPAIVARALGLRVPLDFRVPRVPGPGLPLNLEDLLRRAEEELGPGVSLAEWLLEFPRVAHDYIDRLEDYYERGAGAPPPKFRGVYHNLAVWGFTVNEGTTIHSRLCDQVIEEEEGWIEDDFLGTPSAPMYRTARRVLNPGDDGERATETQVKTLARLAGEGPLDALLLWLGANDALGTVLTLELRDMADEAKAIPKHPLKRLAWNLTSEAQFAADVAALVAGVRAALAGQATRIFVGTVPHVTIPPITTGVGHFDGKYFDHYARFFVNQENFSPLLHKTLTREQAQRIDARIDAFNAILARAVADANAAEARRRARHVLAWHLVDCCAVLDELAVKRQGLGDRPEQALVRYYARRGVTDHPLLQLAPIPSILKLQTDEHGRRTGGGLMSLDGVHPSTIGYGLVAEVFLAAMQSAGVPGADPARVPWAEVIANDPVLQRPPRLWDDVLRAGANHATLWDLIFRVMA
jgi:lysophospholipase L1-like esterase